MKYKQEQCVFIPTVGATH